MAFNATVLRVLIASPGDVPEEREAIPQIIRRWNSRHAETEGIVLLPVMWEIDGTPGYEQRKDGQEILNEDIVDKCDVVIAVFYSRLGTPTLRAKSGTVEEIQRFVDAGKPVAVYFSDRPLSPSAINTDQLAQLRAFKEDFRQKGLGFDFSDIGQFREMLRDHIDTLAKKAVERIKMDGGQGNDSRNTVTPSSGLPDNSRQIRVEVGLGFATGWRTHPAVEFMRSIGLPVPEQEKENPILLIVKAINEGTRAVTINSWGLNVSAGSIIPPIHRRCTNVDLPARLEDGESLVGWIEYDSVKEHGFEFPRDKGNVWVEDATGKRWFCTEVSE